MALLINILTVFPILMIISIFYGDIGNKEFSGYYFLGFVILFNLLIIKVGSNKDIESKFMNSLTVLMLFVLGGVFAILSYMKLYPDDFGSDFLGHVFLFSSFLSLLPLYAIFKTKVTKEKKINFMGRLLFKLRGIPFLLLAFLIISFSIFDFLSTKDFISSAENATAKVTKLIENRSNNGVSYTPVFKFRDNEGKVYSVHSNASSSSKLYEVNESVEILFNPKSPSEAKINSTYSLWGGSILVGSIGLIFLYLGVVLFILTLKRYNILEHHEEEKSL